MTSYAYHVEFIPLRQQRLNFAGIRFWQVLIFICTSYHIPSSLKMQQVQTPYYYYMPVPMEGDQQQGYPMPVFVETPEPEVVQPKEETKKEVQKCDAENQKKKSKRIYRLNLKTRK
jgi:hypothetical protein